MLKTFHHSHSCKAGQTLFWNSTDSEKLYEKNICDPKITKKFESNGWTTKTSIVYQYNSQGFRTQEFDQRPSYIALGCSVTEGVGISHDQTWPHQLSKLTNCHVWNLGVSGSSMGTCVRLLDHYINFLNVEAVFVLWPSNTRLERFTGCTWETAVPNYESNVLGFQQWLCFNENLEVEQIKCQYSVRYICAQRKIPLVEFSYDIESKEFIVDDARDCNWKPNCTAHPGPKSNSMLASMYYKKFLEYQ